MISYVCMLGQSDLVCCPFLWEGYAMTEKELRKLSRAELLEMLISQSKELQSCQEKLTAAEAALQRREIAIDKAGSIAEASLMLSGIFDAAQLACQQYTDNIKTLSERQESVCARLEAESRAKAVQLLSETKKKCADLERETRAECEAMRSKAKAESQQYWDKVSEKLEAFYEAHDGLRELLNLCTTRGNQENG